MPHAVAYHGNMGRIALHTPSDKHLICQLAIFSCVRGCLLISKPRSNGWWNSTIADHKDQPVMWIWEGFIAEPGITLLTGAAKLSKSTLVSMLLDRRRAGGRGSPGQACPPGHHGRPLRRGRVFLGPPAAAARLRAQRLFQQSGPVHVPPLATFRGPAPGSARGTPIRSPGDRSAVLISAPGREPRRFCPRGPRRVTAARRSSRWPLASALSAAGRRTNRTSLPRLERLACPRRHPS